MTAEDKLAQDLRDEIEARYRSYKMERATLAAAASRTLELDALIAFIEAPTPTIKIAPRPAPMAAPSAIKSTAGTK
jgi:hypothetical protein